jgi:FixJ family two-component response regulator
MTEPIQPAGGEGRRLLIVEDDEAVLKSLGDYFALLKYDVARAPSGKQGLAAFESHQPDVTLLDLKLPDLDGLQVLEALRRKRAMVIMLTGYGDIPTAVRAMQLGAENFLTKPVDLPHLAAAIERAIEKLELRRENSRLRELVPSTRKRMQRLAATAVLLLGALWVGNLVGGLGERRREVTPIAPRRPATDSPATRDLDSLLYPGGARADSAKR